MKVIDIIKRKDFHINQELIEQSSIKITKDNINANLTIALNMNEDVECIYYWYDHLTRGTIAVNEIVQSLNDKNWDVFSQYLYNKKQHKCTLPNQITVFLGTTCQILGKLEINEETIQFLTYAEYECG